MPILTCRRVIYYSPGDEDLFFAWLDRIKAIRRWEGRGEDVLLHVPTEVSGAAYRELDALFRRYRVNRRQLAKLRLRPSSSSTPLRGRANLAELSKAI